MTSTQLVLFGEVQFKKIWGPPTTSRLNECNALFPRNEEGEVNVKRGVYETNNQPKKSTFKYKQEGRLCLRLANVKNDDETITGNHCPVFDYNENNILMIDAYKKGILNEFTRIRNLI